MEKKKNIFKRIWDGIVRYKTITIIIVIVFAVAAFILIRGMQTRAEAVGNYQTAALARGTLTATIGATGNVRANQSVILSWQTSGRVDKVYIGIGELVHQGDVLAALAPTSLSQSLILAQADLVSAERTLENLLVSNTPTAQAQLALVTAQQKYDSAKYTVDAMLAINRGATTDDIRNAEAQNTLALHNLELAQNAYDRVKDRPDDDLMKAQAFTALYNARLAAERAQNNLNYFLLVPSGRDLERVRANLAVAGAQLADAQREWERLMDGPDAGDILAAQARVDAARAAVGLAQISAPFAGVVTDAIPMPGDQVTPGMTAFRIDDLTRLLVDVQVSEVDINRVKIGQPVIVTFDAVLGQEYNGKVVQVDQAASIVSGMVNFGVTVELTDADDLVKPGMTAAVTITVNQLEDVLLVPNRAVRLSEGTRFIYILDGTRLEMVEITLGASSDAYSELASGEVEAGDVIVLNPPAEWMTSDGPPAFVRMQP